MKLSIDMDKFVKTVEELGIGIEYGSEKTGVLMVDTGEYYELRDFFADAFAMVEEDERREREMGISSDLIN